MNFGSKRDSPLEIDCENREFTKHDGDAEDNVD